MLIFHRDPIERYTFFEIRYIRIHPLRKNRDILRDRSRNT